MREPCTAHAQNSLKNTAKVTAIKNIAGAAENERQATMFRQSGQFSAKTCRLATDIIKDEVNVIGGNREVLQNEFRYDFRKGPREISAGTVITVLKAKMHVNIVNTVPGEISRGPFRKSYRNSFCKTSLIVAIERRKTAITVLKVCLIKTL